MNAKTQVQRDADAEIDRRHRAASEPESATNSQVFTYPDGSQRVGLPPFPKESPLEQDLRTKNEESATPTPMHIPHGMKTSGEPAPAENGTSVTVDQFKARVKQQVESDVTSGKDPATPNPTTASDKPELANVTTADALQAASEPVTAEDLAKIAVNIKPDVEATPEQIEAAALQVARETKGVIPDAKASKKK
jgi:hypothetical protein